MCFPFRFWTCNVLIWLGCWWIPIASPWWSETPAPPMNPHPVLLGDFAAKSGNMSDNVTCSLLFLVEFYAMCFLFIYLFFFFFFFFFNSFHFGFHVCSLNCLLTCCFTNTCSTNIFGQLAIRMSLPSEPRRLWEVFIVVLGGCSGPRMALKTYGKELYVKDLPSSIFSVFGEMLMNFEHTWFQPERAQQHISNLNTACHQLKSQIISNHSTAHWKPRSRVAPGPMQER